jgi:hypothetical protein
MVINEQDVYGLTNKQVLKYLGLRMKEKRVNVTFPVFGKISA